MNIDAIRTGIVIDHITAGLGMRLYDLLGLEKLDCSVAIIKNVHSDKMGKKDIIKIDADIPVNLDVTDMWIPASASTSSGTENWWRSAASKCRKR